MGKCPMATVVRVLNNTINKLFESKLFNGQIYSSIIKSLKKKTRIIGYQTHEKRLDVKAPKNTPFPGRFTLLISRR